MKYNMSRFCYLVGFVMAVGSVSANELDYEVFVDIGETNRIDETFVTAMGVSTNLVKRGRGVLWSSSAMSSYTGMITVEEGAFMISAASDVGSGDGGTVVKPGATLVIHTGSDVEGSAAANNLNLASEPIVVGGAGDAQWGGAIYQPAGDSEQKYVFGDLTLSDDTRIRIDGAGMGIRGGSTVMNGHRLTISGGLYCIYRSAVADSMNSRVGDIVVESGTLLFGAAYMGDFGCRTNTVTVKPGARVHLDNCKLRPLYCLVVEDGGIVKAVGRDVGGDLNIWSGDVIWNASATEDVIVNAGVSLTFGGSVSGIGGMKSSRGILCFERTCNLAGGLILSDTKLSLPSSDNFWGHGGLRIGYYRGQWAEAFRSDYNRVGIWRHCAEGPGPHLSQSYWSADFWSPDSWDTDGNKHTLGAKGYIWNRDPTNVTLTIRCQTHRQNFLALDGDAIWSYKNMFNSNATFSFDIAANSCREFLLVTIDGGAQGGPYSDNEKLYGNGIVLKDPGNGYLFTTDTVSRAECIMENQTELLNMSLAGVTELDAGGMPMTVKALSGSALVTNVTTFAVSNSWTVTASELMEGRSLTVYGDVVFDAGAKISVSGLSGLSHSTTKSYVLCTAESIVGFPSGTRLKNSNGRTWLFSLSADGKMATLDYEPSGLKIILL